MCECVCVCASFLPLSLSCYCIDEEDNLHGNGLGLMYIMRSQECRHVAWLFARWRGRQVQAVAEGAAREWHHLCHGEEHLLVSRWNPRLDMHFSPRTHDILLELCSEAHLEVPRRVPVLHNKYGLVLQLCVRVYEFECMCRNVTL